METQIATLEETCNILTQLPEDLLAAEIFTWLSYGQLAKVARVSKKFSGIIKRIGSFTIDTYR